MMRQIHQMLTWRSMVRNQFKLTMLYVCLCSYLPIAFEKFSQKASTKSPQLCPYFGISSQRKQQIAYSIPTYTSFECAASPQYSDTSGDLQGDFLFWLDQIVAILLYWSCSPCSMTSQGEATPTQAIKIKIKLLLMYVSMVRSIFMNVIDNENSSTFSH